MIGSSSRQNPLFHPLATDMPTMKITLLDKLQALNPKGTIRNLVLEDIPSAAGLIMSAILDSPHERALYDTMLLQSILAFIDLHQSGAYYQSINGQRELSSEEKKVAEVMGRVYKESTVKQMIQVYGLDIYEHRAVVAYTSPYKKETVVASKANELYMGQSEQNWGKTYGDGWHALDSALKKLPSLRTLGLELTTYRATRQKTESDSLHQLVPESHVKLGVQVMDMGQYHYTSTALTYNGHWGRVKDVGGMMAITGHSGVYINPFGMFSYVDGGEILYPPTLLTTYEGENPSGYQGVTKDGEAFTVPVFHLREVASEETGQQIVEDKAFAVQQPKDLNLDQNKLARIKKIEAIVEQNGMAALWNAQKAAKVSGPIMYLTINELDALLSNM